MTCKSPEQASFLLPYATDFLAVDKAENDSSFGTVEASWSGGPAQRAELINEYWNTHCDPSGSSYVDNRKSNYPNDLDTSHIKSRGIRVDFFAERTPKHEIRSLATMAVQLNRLFPNSQNRKINFTATGGNSGVSPLGLRIRDNIGLTATHATEQVRLGRYVHEFGHLVWLEHMNDPELKQLLFGSFIGGNHLMIQDSTYIQLEEASSNLGHIDEETELFASAFFAFYYEADTFVSFIQNPETPDEMKQFGMAMWEYMRDRVFQGKVFTADKSDPFPDANLDDYLAHLSMLDPNEVLLQACADNSQTEMGVFRATQYADIPRAIENLSQTLSQLSSAARKESYRQYLYQIGFKNFHGFLNKADILLSENLPESERLELLNILGMMLTEDALWKQSFLVLLEREQKIGTEKSKQFAAKIFADRSSSPY